MKEFNTNLGSIYRSLLTMWFLPLFTFTLFILFFRHSRYLIGATIFFLVLAIFGTFSWYFEDYLAVKRLAISGNTITIELNNAMQTDFDFSSIERVKYKKIPQPLGQFHKKHFLEMYLIKGKKIKVCITRMPRIDSLLGLLKENDFFSEQQVQLILTDVNRYRERGLV